MKRLLVLAALVGAVGLTIAVVSGGASTVRGTHIHVVEHATTDATADVDPVGDSPGDVLTFHNGVFNAADTTKVGRDQGYCIRIKAPGSYECNWTTILPQGHITVEGPFYDSRDSTLAITGGTGAFRDARGFMHLRSRSGGAEYDFVFHFSG